MTEANKKSAQQSTADQLRSYVDRMERLAEERQNLTEDMTAVMNEAKANGYDTRAIKQILKIRKNPDAHNEIEHIVDIYKQALGMSVAE